MNRIEWIDDVKGCAILLVVAAHVAERYYKFDLFPSYTPAFRLIFNIIYSFHMPLFMILSGFLFQLSYMTPSWENGRGKFWKHWTNWAIIYTGFSVLLGLVKIKFSNDLLHPVKLLDCALIWVKPIGHMWYLYVLLIIYLIFVCARRVNLCVKLIISTVICLMSTFVTTNWFGLNHLTRYIFFFFVGMWGVIYFDLNMHTIKRLFMAFISLMALAIGMVAWTNGISTERLWGIQLLVGLGLSIGAIWVLKKASKCRVNKLLRFVSAYSLEIYLLHQYPVALFVKLVPSIRGSVCIGYLFNVLTSIAMVIVGVEVLKKIRLYMLFFRPVDVLCKLCVKIKYKYLHI